MATDLPIDAVLPDLIAALRRAGCAVLQAPPGAGKTTRVPLAMLEAGLVTGRIVMLEPRRLAVRAAAERMAETLGEPVGQSVGYRMRGETRVSPETRIEVVTEGILTRMIQSDPELAGIGALIFDEFHERSLNADLGLALAWEVRGALREDLVVLAMSATLDADPLAAMLGGAPVVTSEGRSFPIETRWLDRPVPKDARFETAVAGLVRQAVDETEGGVLVFLPGEGEIRRVAGMLDGRLPAGVEVRPLYGALPFARQRAAIAPALSGRKVVLSTAIAETALTIEDIRVVVDGGRARRARFDPGRAMSRLVTERATRAEAAQRQGRAGRVAPGICYRLWARGEEVGMQPYPPPEIAAVDLTGLALELALWGSRDAGDLAFLTPPSQGVLAEARGLLRDLGALDAAGAITPHGRAMAAMPLHPRIAHMLLSAGPGAATMAALLSERDPLRGAGADLTLRLDALRDPVREPRAARALHRIAAEADRLRTALQRRDGPCVGEGRDRPFPAGQRTPSPGALAALAYPDRVGLRRKGDAPRWVLSGGTGAVMDAADPLAGARLIVATDLDGAGREARIRQAVQIGEADLRALYDDRIAWRDVCNWSRRERAVVARRQERFGALVLADRRWDDAPADAVALAMLDGVRDLGLPWSPAARRLQARTEFLRTQGADLPDCSDAGLTAALEDWLLPYLPGVRTAAELKALDLAAPLRGRLGRDGGEMLDRLAPGHVETPLGRKVPVDYAGGVPAIEVRLQEMFGVTEHPVAGPDRLPVKVTLLSPAQRPLAVTTDLPGFWASAYGDVRKDMRGRYPKHPWPEDPTKAEPTLRAKPRRQ
ncbi:MAG: ATP-dependent helicase HrpB [Rhodobacter sp.]|nr:ATP-dependent helicase HrpB [Rhodobacter sp.]